MIWCRGGRGWLVTRRSFDGSTACDWPRSICKPITTSKNVEIHCQDSYHILECRVNNKQYQCVVTRKIDFNKVVFKRSAHIYHNIMARHKHLVAHIEHAAQIVSYAFNITTICGPHQRQEQRSDSPGPSPLHIVNFLQPAFSTCELFLLILYYVLFFLLFNICKGKRKRKKYFLILDFYIALNKFKLTAPKKKKKGKKRGHQKKVV